MSSQYSKITHWLQEREVEITGNSAGWWNHQKLPQFFRSENEEKISWAIAIASVFTGLYAFLEVYDNTSRINNGTIDILFYSTIISVVTAFSWWVVLNVLVRGTFWQTPTKAMLGLVSAWLVFTFASKVSGFVLIKAEWDVVWANRVLIIIGQYMTEGMTQDYRPNENWRLWPAFYLITTLLSAAYGTSDEKPKKFLIQYTLVSALFLIIAWNPNHSNYDTSSSSLKVLGASVCAYSAFGMSYYYCNQAEEYQVNRLRSWLGIASVLTFFLTLLMMNPPKFMVDAGYVEQGVKPTQWGGLFVNLVLATTGCVLGFFVGVFLAFGRQSELPFFKWPSIGIIELVRSGPLICWLFIAKYLFKDIIVPVYELDEILRMLLIFSLFGGCYIAEVLRGGLQAVPHGQIEAATALGLTPIQTKMYIELPNAIRTTLPSLVGVFIGLWKDTTLVFIVGILDFFKLSKDLPNTDLRFLGDFLEPLYMAAVVFWAFSFFMSRISRGLESKLGLTNKGGGEAT